MVRKKIIESLSLRRIKELLPRRWQDDIFFIISMAATCDICLLLQPVIADDTHVPLLFLLAVLIIARYTEGYLYGLLASILAPLIVNYCFIYPYFRISFQTASAPVTFVSLLVVGIMASIMTIRAKQQEQVKLQIHRAQLRANLLRAVGHDLRTPLTSIVGSAEMLLQENTLSPDRRQALLKNISNESEWLTRLVESLLFATQFSGNPADLRLKPAAMEELIGEAIQTFHKQYPDVRITATVPDELVMVEVDTTMLEQVLFNVMQNAVLHGVAIHIDIVVSVTKHTVLCEVQNDGVLFNAEQLEHLFDEYVNRRTKHREWDRLRSLGIGLPVCRAIVQAHGGNIGAKNTAKGATVWITLPERRTTN